jgi:flavin prenyltransferase
VRVFLGITGASGGPYAARLLEALAAADCEVGVSASAAGIQVLATELYADATLPRDEVLARFTEGVESVTIYDPTDYGAPYASGSAKVDGYVICPCSMSTVGTIAAGAMANLIHRAASVALKENRRLVLVPRETPLSAIHLEGLLKLRQAGAVILFAAPGFYHGASLSDASAEPTRSQSGVASERLSIDDLVDFVVGRCLDQLGLENALIRRWGDS